MSAVSDALAIALGHHQRGQLETAEQIYRQILHADPNQPDAMHLLGVIARQVGCHEVAVELIGRAIQLKSASPEYHNNLGGAYLDLRRFPDAIASFRRAVQLKPDYAVAHSNLGGALREQGNLDEAVECCRRAVKLNPEYADGHVNLGNALRDLGKLDNAITCYRRALERNPNSAIAHNNIGNALKDLGSLEKAVASYRRSLELNSRSADTHNNLGNALKDLGRTAEAMSCFQQAIQLNPKSAEAHSNLGNLLFDLGRLEEAAASCRTALEYRPDYPHALNNLGNALMGLGKFAEAVSCYRRVLELTPNDAKACNNLAGALQAQGQSDQAVIYHRRALDLNPDFVQAHSNLLLTLQYRDDASLANLYEAHAEFDRRHAASLAGPLERPTNRNDRLRIGLVSADFRRHPVGYFLVSILENFDRETLEVYCYSDRIRSDDLTSRLQAAATSWHDTTAISDTELADRIRQDGIEILFDLSGHTAHNRLLAFARKPAPIQVTWAGYACTTGLSAMDYILADNHEIPADAEPFYRERVLRMPDGYVCYEAPAYAPPVNDLPVLKSGTFTFGCFNNPAKVTPRVIELWIRILRRLPTARLVLKSNGWDDQSMQSRVLDRLDSAIEASRIEFQGQSSHAELLAEYNRIDLALDPFPYSGGLTTCESLWMGVPVITCPGETFASRHSLSHLSNVGLTGTIANDFDDYVERAVNWANDTLRLAEVRSKLRSQMAASPLCNGKLFATNLSSLLQEIRCASNED